MLPPNITGDTRCKPAHVLHAEPLELGPSQVRQNRQDRPDPEALPPVAGRGDATAQRAVGVGEPAFAEAGVADLNATAIMVDWNLHDLGFVPRQKVHTENTPGALTSAPAKPIAVRTRDVAGNKVAQGVDDGRAAVCLEALDDVGMMPQDQRRAGVGKGTGLFDLGRRRDQEPFLAPVKGNNDVVYFAAQAADIVGQPANVEWGHAPLSYPGALGRPASLIHSAKEGEARTSYPHESGPDRFRQVIAGAEIGDPKLIEKGPCPMEAVCEAIEYMVVRQCDNVEAWCQSLADHLGGSNDPGLGGHHNSIASDRTLKVAEDDIATAEQGPDLLRQQSRSLRHHAGRSGSKQDVANRSQPNWPITDCRYPGQLHSQTMGLPLSQIESPVKRRLVYLTGPVAGKGLFSGRPTGRIRDTRQRPLLGFGGCRRDGRLGGAHSLWTEVASAEAHGTQQVRW